MTMPGFPRSDATAGRMHCSVPKIQAHQISEKEHAMDESMDNVREIVFIDRAVADIPALVAGLRPGMATVLLDGKRPAAEVIAHTVRGYYEGLDAIHIFVHGRPGELNFS